MEDNQVVFRGWDYPHANTHWGFLIGEDFLEDATDWLDHVEFWRFYRSAQFLHLRGCIEDWWGDVRIYWSQEKISKPSYGLEFLNTLYNLSEIYEFASRLAKKKTFDDNLKIAITLKGMKDRKIVTTEINRPLLDGYICTSDEIPLARTVTVEEIIAQNKTFAIDDTLQIFEHFNFFNPPRKTLEDEQEKLIKHIF
jgi:hypothetical protein